MGELALAPLSPPLPTKLPLPQPHGRTIYRMQFRSLPTSADSIPAIGFLLPTSRSAQTIVMVYSCRPDVDSSYIDYKSTNTNLTNFFTLVRVARFRFTHPNPLGQVADISAQYIVPFCGFLLGNHVRQQNNDIAGKLLVLPLSETVVIRVG